MGQIELWTGLPGSGRRGEALKRVRDTASGGRTVWWIVDAERRAERMEQMLLGDTGAFAGVDVVVSGRLARHVLVAQGVHAPTLPVEVRELLLRELMSAKDVRQEAGAELAPGWAKRLADLFERIESGEHELEQPLGRRFPWVLTVFDRYRDRLAGDGRVDEAWLPRLAAEAVTPPRAPLPDLMVVDRPGPLPPPVVELVHTLADAVPRTVAILDDDTEAGPALDLARIDLGTWRERHEVRERPFDPPPTARALARRVFGPLEPGAEPLEAEADAVYAGDREVEVQHVAREVSRLLHDEGLQQDDVAVVCAELMTYRDLVRELFPRYGVTPDLRLGDPLSASPVARVVVDLFDLRAKGLSRERVTDLLLNPYVRWGGALATERGILDFDSAARSAGIREGRGPLEEAWIEPLTREIERMRARAQRDLDAEADDDEEEGAAQDEALRRKRNQRRRQRAGELEKALAEFRELARSIHALHDECTAEQAREWLDDLLGQLGVRASVQRTGRALPHLAERDVRALGRLKLTLEHVTQSLKLRGSHRWPVSRFAELLRMAVEGVQLAPSRRLSGGVPVMGPLDLRGLRVKHLFLIGLTHESWPPRPEVDLANPMSRRWLGHDRLAESRALTLEAFFAADHLHLCSPAPQKGETEQKPSPLLHELEEAGVTLHKAHITRADAPPSARSLLDLLPEAGVDMEDPETLERGARRLTTAGLLHGTSWAQGALRTAQVELMRQDPRTLTVYEGQLSGSAIGELLAERALENPLSPTRLDSYAKCPMQYFLRHGLGIEELEEVPEELEKRELGGLLHRIIAEATLRLRKVRGGDVDLSENQDEVRRVLLEVAREQTEPLPLESLFRRSQVQELIAGLDPEREEPPGFLARMVQDHAGGRLSGERIRLVEAGFGMGDDPEAGDTLRPDPLIITHEGVRVPLAGRIDRVSLHPNKGWRVWDYKLAGTVKSKKDMEQGYSFQLPVYLWALEDWRDQGHGTDHEVDSAKLYQFKREKGELKISHSGAWSAEQQEEWDRVLRERVATIQGALASARFHHPLTQEDKHCNSRLESNFCPFKHVCRRDHVLWERRRQYLTKAALKGAYLTTDQSFFHLSEEEEER